MVERKISSRRNSAFCPRQNCSFAHGSAELRRFVSSHNGERDYRGRDKLGKRISPERDARSQHALHGPRKKKQHLNGSNEFSETVDGAEARFNELREVQSTLRMLDHRKSELKILLEEKVEEADSLSSIVHELEAQLFKDKEEFKRVASKTKKIIKAQKRYGRLQSELKRSQSRFQKLCDQILSGTITTGGNGEDSNVNVFSDVEPKTNQRPIRPRNLHVNSSTCLVSGGGREAETFRLGKLSHSSQSSNNMEHDRVDYRSDGNWSLENDVKQKRGKSAYTVITSADKLRGTVPGLLLSDELVEVELEENVEVVDNVCTEMDKGESTSTKARRVPFTLPPPPPVLQSLKMVTDSTRLKMRMLMWKEGVEEMVGCRHRLKP